jgi:hypothetical protein
MFTIPAMNDWAEGWLRMMWAIFWQFALLAIAATLVAMIAIPNDFPPGVAPGFYRVEITKSGETIPAKYNTDTILGQEAAIDAKGIREGIKFDLKD